MNTRILYIDDDADDHELMRSALASVDSSIELNCQESAISALEYLKDHSPDLILSDLNMPLMDGFSFLKRAMKDERLRDIPIIIFSTSSEFEQIKESLLLGARSFITKPQSYYGLKDTLHKLISTDWTQK